MYTAALSGCGTSIVVSATLSGKILSWLLILILFFFSESQIDAEFVTWDGSMLKLTYFINSLPLQLLIGLLVIVTRRVNCYLIQRLSLQASKFLQIMCTEKV